MARYSLEIKRSAARPPGSETLVGGDRFREQALEQIAADWLDANGIAYRRD